MRDSRCRAGAAGDRVDACGVGHRRALEVERAIGAADCDSARRRFVPDHVRFSIGDSNLVDRFLRFLRRCDDDRVAVMHPVGRRVEDIARHHLAVVDEHGDDGPPGHEGADARVDRVDPVGEVGSEPSSRAAGAVVEPQLEEIRLVSRARLRAPCDPPPVGRVHRTRVAALPRGDAPRRSTGHRYEEDVAVRGDLRMIGGVLRVRELLAVGRDVEFVAAADGERRRIERARRQIARGASIERHVQDVRARRLLPRFPMAKEEVGNDARFGRPLFGRAGLVLDACRIDAAVGINIGYDDER